MIRIAISYSATRTAPEHSRSTEGAHPVRYVPVLWSTGVRRADRRLAHQEPPRLIRHTVPFAEGRIICISPMAQVLTEVTYSPAHQEPKTLPHAVNGHLA